MMDTLELIGYALVWYGLGVLSVAIAWAAEKVREARKIERTIQDLFGEPAEGRGHVIDYHPHGTAGDGTVLHHAHCICGEMSLDYRVDDPSAERLMERWADTHIDSQMESAGR